ncbi:hypothetical protein BDW71DRAFT_45315 [Aspergillus fruticulosus]
MFCPQHYVQELCLSTIWLVASLSRPSVHLQLGATIRRIKTKLLYLPALARPEGCLPCGAKEVQLLTSPIGIVGIPISLAYRFNSSSGLDKLLLTGKPRELHKCTRCI